MNLKRIPFPVVIGVAGWLFALVLAVFVVCKYCI